MDPGVAAVGSPSGMVSVLERIAAIQARFATTAVAAGAASSAGLAAPSSAQPFAAAPASARSFAAAPESSQPFAAALAAAVAKTDQPAADDWVLPVQGPVTSPFGMREHPVTGVYKLHTGTDFAAPTGEPIGAARDGVVRSAGWQSGNGNTVVIDHGDGVSTLYGHASTLLVQPGQRVSAGQAIAKVGETGLATGPHLHLEVRVDDRPVDPMRWLRRHSGAV